MDKMEILNHESNWTELKMITELGWAENSR